MHSRILRSLQRHQAEFMAAPHRVQIGFLAGVILPLPRPALRTALAAAARLTLRKHATPSSRNLSVMLGTNYQLQQFNFQFAKLNVATDVLSFPADGAAPDGYLGDIVISVEMAVQQAVAHSRTTLAELQLLTVHGTLHLLGYDHATKAERSTMWAVQEQIIAALAPPTAARKNLRKSTRLPAA